MFFSFSFARGVATLGLLLALAAPAAAQTVSTWSGAGGNGNWNNPGNWNVLPVSGPGTEIVFGGSQHLTNMQNIANPFTLTRLSINGTNTGDVTINGGGLSFVPGTNSALISTAGSQGVLYINTPLDFSGIASMSFQMGTTNSGTPTNPSLNINGSITNIAANSITLNTASPGKITRINSANNVGFNGTLNMTSNALIQLGAVNAVWRKTNIITGNIAAIITGTSIDNPSFPATGSMIDTGYNQQIGNISGDGEFLFGPTGGAATGLVGFLNTSSTLNGQICGVNIGSHFGKVGTGILTVLGRAHASKTACSGAFQLWAYGEGNHGGFPAWPGSLCWKS